MVVCFRYHAPRTAAPIPVSPPGGSGSGRKGTDPYLVTVDIISAGKKCGSVRYPLVSVDNLNGVLKRTSFYQAVEESGPPLLAAFFVRDGGSFAGEPFVTLDDFLGQVGICDVYFITTWYEPEKAICGEALASARMECPDLLRQREHGSILPGCRSVELTIVSP